MGVSTEVGSIDEQDYLAVRDQTVIIIQSVGGALHLTKEEFISTERVTPLGFLQLVLTSDAYNELFTIRNRYFSRNDQGLNFEDYFCVLLRIIITAAMCNKFLQHCTKIF